MILLIGRIKNIALLKEKKNLSAVLGNYTVCYAFIQNQYNFSFMTVTLVINLSKWPSGKLKCHPCIALFHRRLEALFKVQLPESLNNLLSLKEVYFDPYLSDWQWSEIFTELLLAASSFFKARKHTNIFWLQIKIVWRALNLHRNGILTVIRVLVNQAQLLSCGSIVLLHFSVQSVLFRNHEEGLKELHQFHESWILPNPSHFRLEAKVIAKELSQAYMAYEYICLNYF